MHIIPSGVSTYMEQQYLSFSLHRAMTAAMRIHRSDDNHHWSSVASATAVRR